MKTGIMIGMIVAAIVAGGAGGFVVTELLSDDDGARPEVSAATTEPAPRPRPMREMRDSRVGDLLRKIEGLESKLNKLEARQSDELSDEVAELKAKIEGLESSSVSLKGAGEVADGEGEGSGGIADLVDERVNAVLEKREKAEQEEQDQQRQQFIERRREAERERVITAMTEKLSLTPLQQTNIKTKLEDYQAKRGEIWTKAREARLSGEEFDFRAESQRVETEARNAIEDELSLTQVSSFQELLGDDGQIANIGQEGRRRFGGMRRGN